MLTTVLGHAGTAPAPHDLAGAWNLDPLLLGGIALAAVAYRRGQTGGRRREIDRWRARAFFAALSALAVALVSPLDVLAGALASAHMVQHVVMLLVAAPLLAFSAPSGVLLRGSPLAVRRGAGRLRRTLRLSSPVLGPLRHPAVVWVLHSTTLWLWHAPGAYDAAVASRSLHIAEHLTFLGTGWLFWRVTVGGRGVARASPGTGVLLVFTMAMQSVFLSVLLTFASSPWYRSYLSTTTAWGLDPLSDQQLAGLIMWVPAGLIYLGAALALLVAWIRAGEREALLS